MNRRFITAGAHLGLSLCVALMASLLVFMIWYPSPYDKIAGGAQLFFLAISVDVVLGPLLTAVVADAKKPRRELIRDLAVIVILQLAGLSYGIYSIALARPVIVAFEVDRFHVATAAEIDPSTWDEAPADLRSPPWFGPRLIAAVKPTDPAEQLRSIDLALGGMDLAMQPRSWRTYASQSNAAWAKARPLPILVAKYPQELSAAQEIADRAGQTVGKLRFLPLVSRLQKWSAVIAAPDARIVGYLPADAYF